MQKAFVVGILLAIIIPCIGVIIVLKRLSMIGDALSHSSLAGVATGLMIGMNPILGAIVSCVVAAMGIEFIRKRIPRYSEMAIAIIMSASIAIAGVMSGFVKNATNFNSFLFGSIVAISDFEMAFVVCISIVVLLTFCLLYKELFLISFNEKDAAIAGVPVNIVNSIHTILTALTVSIAARTVGALIVSSMMVVPVACAMQWAKSYKQTIIFSILFAISFTVIGLFASYYARLKPGATIILVGIISFLFSLIINGNYRKNSKLTNHNK